MLTKNWMSTKVVTIDVNDSMSHAVNLTKEHAVRMLPVLKDGRLVGILSDTDLKRASASDATTLDIHEMLYLISRIKVADIMTKKPVTVSWDSTIEEVAEVLLKNNISGAPVLDEEKKVVGIITRNDIFRALVSLSGLGKKGVQFSFRVEDRPGSIREVTDIIRRYGARIASILSTQEEVPAGFRKVYIRAYDIERDSLQKMLEEMKQKATILYFVDHRHDAREIFD
jgi:acetoin utilization protein AcuB